MTLSDLQYIRLILTLPYRVVLRELLGQGNGTIARFQTQLWPIIADTCIVYLDGETVEPEDYELDEETGLVTFETAPEAEAVVTADYNWSAFNDEQIEGLLDRYNDSVQAVLVDLVKALLSNSDLFIKYTIGMESIDRTKAYDALARLLDDLAAKSAAAVAQAVIWTQSDVDEYERDVPWWEDTLTSTPHD
jgi:hypothetical protein